MIIAIQGQAGSFHEQVAKQWYGESTDILPCTTFAEVFEAYEAGDADAIVTAVENSIYGSINDVYQLIEDCTAPIVGEVTLKIDQNLIALPGATLQNLTSIYSHPVALAQCRETLHKLAPNAELIEFFDTAGAVEYVKEVNDNTIAAVASERAAKLYGAPVIQHKVQDNDHNITRFLVIEDTDTDPESDRASLVVTTNNKPGALVEVLNVFARANVNLAKLQSQPIVGQPWRYKFFIVVDCAGDNLRKMVTEIEKNDHQVTLLGEYKTAA